jgi:benzoyl-CoA 2,3-dioxygenase component A
MQPTRQHLIDPEICIRCNTCEETCPIDAVTHNEDNYVVDAAKCKFCLDCISPCPTGAIDNWRVVTEYYSLDDQFSWDELPEQEEDLEEAEAAEGKEGEAVEEEATEILGVAHAAEGGKVPPPWSAAHPYINLYTREAPITARVAGNYRITKEGTESDIHHIVLDFGQTAFPVLEGQSIGIIPPGTNEKGEPHLMRLYSVASPRDGERPNHNNLALTIKRVRTEKDGEQVEGLGSNFMCDVKKGDEVQVTGPYGASFLMPNHPTANIIMICTGTGAAPFRAMTEHRRRHMPDAPGKLLLFFGARTPDELPYFGPLKKLPASLIDKELVFSRLADQPKEYVQDRMLKRGNDLADLLKSEDTYIFICGLKGMEEGVEKSFAQICDKAGMDWNSVRRDLRKSGRYHMETY